MSDTMHVISAGAAKALVQSLVAEFERQHRVSIDSRFGAVGAMQDALLSGAPCDVLILTRKLVADLARDGLVRSESIQPLGRVYTGIAVPANRPHPALADRAALARTLSRASALYFPDPERATAGIHFAKVIASLGLSEALAPRLKPYPNGAAAMHAMAQAGDPDAIGCTQVTEILYTKGVELVGALPKEFELSTIYAAAVCARAEHAQEAASFVGALTGDASLDLRRRGGFEMLDHSVST